MEKVKNWFKCVGAWFAKWGPWFFKSFIWLGIVMLVIDIITKNVIVAQGATPGSTIAELIPGFLRISYVVNTNAAFGLGANDPTVNRVVYIVIAIIAITILLLIFILRYKKLTKFVKSCLMLMVAGAFGNLIDRVFFSPEYLRAANNGVVDWIDFYGVWRFNFNIADSALVVGTAMLIVWLIVDEVKEAKRNKTKVTTEAGNGNAVETKTEEKVEQKKDSK